MKTKDIIVGGTYLTYIGQALSRVEVVGVVEGREDATFASDRRTRFRVRRVGESTPLPKPRSAAALRLPPTRAAAIVQGGQETVNGDGLDYIDAHDTE